jgi:hypothetical protein
MTDIDEIAAAFEKFDLPGDDPKWSSWLLDRLIETILSNPQYTMTDLFRGFDLALKRNGVHLTEMVANLIKDVALTGFFTRYKTRYEKAEWGWANDEIEGGVSAARAYLFLRTLPPDKTTPASLVAILRALEGSPRFDEAVAALSDDFDRPEVQQELQRWETNGMTAETIDKVHSFL